MNTYVSLACAALLGSAAASAGASGQALETGAPAQDQAQPAAKTPASPQAQAPAGDKLQQVTISGSRANDTDQRRLSTASKMIFGREELDRNGDSNVGDILKRLPGVT